MAKKINAHTNPGKGGRKFPTAHGQTKKPRTPAQLLIQAARSARSHLKGTH